MRLEIILTDVTFPDNRECKANTFISYPLIYMIRSEMLNFVRNSDIYRYCKKYQS